MNVFPVNAHAEPRSLSGDLFRTARKTLRAIGSEQSIEVGEY